jgi:hypothetical protein
MIDCVYLILSILLILSNSCLLILSRNSDLFILSREPVQHGGGSPAVPAGQGRSGQAEHHEG